MREKKQINIEVGEQIRAVREQARLTQEQLAEAIDVSVQFVSDLERGVVGISLSTLRKLCTVLGVSSDRILFGNLSTDHAALFSLKCRNLSPEQVRLLLEIIDRYAAAVNSQNE